MDSKVEELLSFIKQSPSPFHTVQSSRKLLEKAGFREVVQTAAWDLVPGGKYFTEVYGSTLLAFKLGRKMVHGIETSLRIAAAHTDFPCFRVKPAAGVSKEGYGSLNIESYGGLILSTWQDRPLSLAGKVVFAGTDVFHPEVRIVDLARPLLLIPSLAIHMNRKVNEGVALNPQKDLLPLFQMMEEDEADRDFFLTALAYECGCRAEDILSYELSAYPIETGCTIGFAEEFISAPRLDNLTSVKACLDGILQGSLSDGLQVVALFDNEEVGSRTKQGAGSAVLLQLLERIYAQQGWSHEALLQDIAAGFMLSVDVAHALHPNYADKNDPTNKPLLNGGVVLKQAASQSYAGDAEAVAVTAGLCKAKGIPYQHFVNRADAKGGSTLGSIASALVPIRTMDIGVPMLAMHSARETMGVKDQGAITQLLTAFFSEA